MKWKGSFLTGCIDYYYSSNISRYCCGVMIIPPSSYERAQITDSMRKIREEMKNKLGPEAYEERMKKSNDEFKALMAGREVRS